MWGGDEGSHNLTYTETEVVSGKRLIIKNENFSLGPYPAVFRTYFTLRQNSGTISSSGI